MKRAAIMALVLFLAIIILSSAVNANTRASGNDFKITRHKDIEIYPKERMKPNGEFIVSIIKNGKWEEIRRIPADRFSRNDVVEIKGIGGKEKTIRVRIVKTGGGAAYLDSVLLNSKQPLPEKSAVDPWIHRKLSKNDFDVIDADGKAFLLNFLKPVKSKLKLSITGRIEAKEICKIPVEYPTENQLKQAKDFTDFYTYRVGSNKRSLNIDGKINELSGSKPLFREFTLPGSGHPGGYTYGWICNDKENLYVSLDFTPDNTYDGDLDYAKVLVKTNEGLKEFKVSVPEKRWGKPAFTYTDKVSYQHKTYEFKIPMKEIGNKEGDIQVAFTTYGTVAAEGNTEPELAYDSVNNRYLLVYEKLTGLNYNIYGQLVNSDGTLSGNEFVIANNARNENDPVVSFDPATRRYLVAWRFNSVLGDDIYGQIVNVDGTMNGGNFAICNNNETQLSPAVCYDSANDRFDVVWYDSRGVAQSIYGQIVNSDGTLFGTASDVNFVISDAGTNVNNPSVSFDIANGRFLAVWQDERNGVSDIYGQIMNADGTNFGTATNVNFAVCNDINLQSSPFVTFDNVNNRYMAVWNDFRNANMDIYGQIVNADGTLFNTVSNVNFAVCNNVNTQINPRVAFSRALQRYLSIWNDTRGGVYGQYLLADGSAVGTTTDVNFPVANTTLEYVSLAYNDSFANFLSAWDTNINPSTIGLATIGAATLPDIDVNPTTINFGQIAVGTNSNPTTFTVTNDGTGILFVDNLVKSGTNADQFTIQNDNVSGQGINPAGNATFQVVFSPTSYGTKQAYITIPSNDPDEVNVTITLYGNIQYPEPIPTTTTSPTVSPTVTPTVSPTITPTTSPTITPTPSPSPTSTPTMPSLVNPQNGSTTGSTDVTFEWTESKTRETITYQIYLSKNPDLSDPQITDVATNMPLPFKMAGMSIILTGIVIGAGWKKRDTRFYILLVILGTMLLTFTIVGCGGSSGDSGGDSPGTTTVTHTVNNLDPSTTYYWKIVAKNEQGGESSSDIWMFNTP